MAERIPDDALGNIEDPTEGVVNLSVLTWRKRLVVKGGPGVPDIDTEGPGFEDLIVSTSQLARELRECREALKTVQRLPASTLDNRPVYVCDFAKVSACLPTSSTPRRPPSTPPRP